MSTLTILEIEDMLGVSTATVLGWGLRGLPLSTQGCAIDALRHFLETRPDQWSPKQASPRRMSAAGLNMSQIVKCGSEYRYKRVSCSNGHKLRYWWVPIEVRYARCPECLRRASTRNSSVRVAKEVPALGGISTDAKKALAQVQSYPCTVMELSALLDVPLRRALIAINELRELNLVRPLRDAWRCS